jgi:hypothetical protein
MMLVCSKTARCEARSVLDWQYNVEEDRNREGGPEEMAATETPPENVHSSREPTPWNHNPLCYLDDLS